MATSKKTSFNIIKKELLVEYTYLKNIFKMVTIPLQMKGESSDQIDGFLINSSSIQNNDAPLSSRARNICELEDKLQKIKSEQNFTLKNKYMKKSIVSKLNKKAKKMERLLQSNKQRQNVESAFTNKNSNQDKSNAKVAKPIFNNEGKLVFSKFDFADFGENKDKTKKSEKDPKKILNSLQKQEEKVQQLQESGKGEKVKEIMDKIAWKNVLKKAEGEKVKDDATLLKKSVKKMEQKKKQSKKQWDARIKDVQQKKEERQKKRQDNIAKKKKEKKAKIMKTAAKKGRVVI